MSEWIRVGKDNPCPVCERPDYCGITDCGKYAICMRTESNKPTKNGGWLHRLDGRLPHPKQKNPKPKPRPKVDIYETYEKNGDRITDDLRRLLSKELGVTPESLKRLEVGYDGANYSFPMRDADMRVIGLKLRAPNGSKFCVTGSQLGIYWPVKVESAGRELLVICEGESDCAALLDMGFQAIGRPSCSAGVEIIKKFLSGCRRDVLLIADCDEAKTRPDGSKFYPGQEGSERLAKEIDKLCRSLKIITIPGAKDVRRFYQDGGTKAAIECIAENTRFWKP